MTKTATRVVLFGFGIAGLAGGVSQGEWTEAMFNATLLCLSCIGIG